MRHDTDAAKREALEAAGRRLSAPAHWLCAITDVGKRRSINEDAYFLSPDCRLWIVADGMGGHAAGDVASALTIQAIAGAMGRGGYCDRAGGEGGAGSRLAEAFSAAQDRVSIRSLRDHGCQGMGSTAIAGFLDGDALHLCHAGDARGYCLSAGGLHRLTNDHSWVWELVMSGLLTPEEARLHPQRGKVTQAIGMPAGIEPEITSLILKPGDRVLLCSDGLWEALPDRDIAVIAGSDGSMLELASMLVDRANAASGKDNITVVLYEHGH